MTRTGEACAIGSGREGVGCLRGVATFSAMGIILIHQMTERCRDPFATKEMHRRLNVPASVYNDCGRHLLG